MATVEVLPADWLSTKQVAKLLKKNERTVQTMGKDGRIRTKPAGRTEQPLARLYDATDVMRILEGAPRRAEAKDNKVAVVERKKRPTQEARALDTVSLTGQMLAYFKGEHEEQKNEREAKERRQWERDKADREDAREHWEAEQKRVAADRAVAAEERELRLLREKTWISPPEGFRICGLPSKIIVELAIAKKIVAIPSGRSWRVQRASLEAFAG